MRKVIALLAFALLCLAVFPVFAQAETPNPDEPVPTVEAGMDDGSSMVNLNPLNLVGTDNVVFVRFAHAAADGPSVDLYVQELGDTLVVEDLAFGEQTGFMFLPASSYTIVVRGAGSGSEGEVITTMNWNFQQDTSWLVAFVGLISNGSLLLEPVNLLRDDIAADTSRVRVVNYVSGGSALSVNSSAGDDFGQGLGWIGVFDTDLPPGTYSLNVTSQDGTALLTDAVVELESATLTTVLIIGSADGSQPLQLISFNSPTNVSRVQFVNNGSVAIQIFVRPGNLELVAALAPGATSEWMTVSSGAVTFVCYAPGTGPTGQELGAWIGTVLPLRDLTITFMADNTADESDPVFSPSSTPLEVN